MALSFERVGNGFKLEFTWDGMVLIARVIGPHDTFDISVAYWKVVASERERLGADRVLVLEELLESGPRETVVDLFPELVNLGFQGHRVAFVDNVDWHRAEQEQVAILARENGIRAAVFADSHQALTWLRYGDD